MFLTLKFELLDQIRRKLQFSKHKEFMKSDGIDDFMQHHFGGKKWQKHTDIDNLWEMNRVNILCWNWADFVRNGQGGNNWNHLYMPIVIVLAISHKFKQILMQNVDSVHFSQITNISDTPHFLFDFAYTCQHFYSEENVPTYCQEIV